ncbi:hypothetical protein JYU34_002922 [Plutella xylostella]|uniref:Uncharacterized protein n=2 Tax=Plutella xylostella TaxID=51655 RepID=A0ABQ7R3G0_PLUXY|nr:hypothetical protein JYU34_002922 [Plutella xylostella]
MPRGFSTCRVPRKQLIGGDVASTATFTVDTPSPVMVEATGARAPAYCLHLMSGPERHSSDFSKLYCQRPIIQHTDCLNTSLLDCSVTFMVDKNICLLGVQVPTQAPSEETAQPSSASGYSELLYAHLLDADGARLTYTHYTSRVPYRHLLDIVFNRPIYIQRNKVYKVGIVFNKVGWYPMGTCAQQVSAESVFFTFCIGQSSDSVRDGLIRSIIFTY